MIAVLGGLADCGARPDPHPHRRGPQPGAEARAAHGPSAEIDGGAAGRGPSATGGGRDARRTRAQLRRGKEYDFKAVTTRPPPRFGLRLLNNRDQPATFNPGKYCIAASRRLRALLHCLGERPCSTILPPQQVRRSPRRRRRSGRKAVFVVVVAAVAAVVAAAAAPVFANLDGILAARRAAAAVGSSRSSYRSENDKSDQIMEFPQRTIAQIIDSEREMVLTAPQRYGMHYD